MLRLQRSRDQLCLSTAPSSEFIAIPGGYPLTPSLGHSQDRQSHVTKSEQTLTDSFSLDATDSVRLNSF